jgi:MerR family copper efflux transcriptional regulator
MNIGQAANASGISSKMIRHYESIELIKACRRSDAGYRIYTEADLHMLRFIKRARKLGFSLEQIRDLLALSQDNGNPSTEVQVIAELHITTLEKRIIELTEMRDSLLHMIRSPDGEQRTDCPILDELTNPADSG